MTMKRALFLSLATLAAAKPVPATDHPHMNGAEDIVGGSNVSNATMFPFMAAMMFQNSFDCGGSILSATKVLTAAHCAVLGVPSSYSWRVGSLSYDQGGTVAKVINVAVHPNYDSSTTDYDVAVMTLASPLTFGPTVAAAMLVDSGTDPTGGESVTAIGWGRTSDGGPVSPTLRQVTLPVIDRETCNGNYGNGTVITDRMFCAAAAGKDSCNGDSGGPIFDASSKTLYGSVSWGYGCADPLYPGVYADYANSAINAWIRGQI